MAGTEFLKTMARGRNISDERAAADINQALATTRLVKTIDGKNTNILSVKNSLLYQAKNLAIDICAMCQNVQASFLKSHSSEVLLESLMN